MLKMHRTSILLIALTAIICASILMAPVFSSSTNPCSSCHGGYTQYLDILEGNAGNNLPSTLTIGQPSTITVVVENRVNTARYTDLSSVSLTLTSQNGHFTVTAPTYNVGTLPKGTKIATWQITPLSEGTDALVITASGKNLHRSISFSDRYSPNPPITIQPGALPPPPPPPPPALHTVTMQLSPNGTTAPTPGIYNYTSGSSVTFTATPKTGYKFDYWTVNGVTNTTNPMRLTINSNLAISPVFTSLPPPPPPPPPPPTTYTVTLQSSPNGTTTPSAGAYNYTSGSSVTFTAIPSAGYKFDYWLVDGVANTTNPMIKTITSNIEVTPTFTLQTQPPPPAPTAYFTTMQSSPNGTTTPSAGAYNYTSGSSVTFTATPKTGYKFDYWTVNGVTNTTNPLILLINSNLVIAPVFTLPPPPAPLPTYTLIMQMSPNGTTIPATGIYSHMSGTSETFTAMPNVGYKFDYWLVDGIAITSNPLTLTVNSNVELIPVFTQQIDPISLSSFRVTLESSVNGTTSPASGIYSYAAGDNLTLIATPNTNYRFDYWLINDIASTKNPLTISVNSDATIIPKFSLGISPAIISTSQENSTITMQSESLTIVMLSPALGEKWQAGTAQKIQWYIRQGIAPFNIIIEYSTSINPETWTTIADGININSLVWMVPNNTQTYTLRTTVVDSSNPPQTASFVRTIETAPVTLSDSLQKQQIIQAIVLPMLLGPAVLIPAIRNFPSRSRPKQINNGGSTLVTRNPKVLGTATQAIRSESYRPISAQNIRRNSILRTYDNKS